MITLDVNKVRIPHAEQGSNWDILSSNSLPEQQLGLSDQSDKNIHGYRAKRSIPY